VAGLVALADRQAAGQGKAAVGLLKTTALVRAGFALRGTLGA